MLFLIVLGEIKNCPALFSLNGFFAVPPGFLFDV
jgi:hypothetical protein